GQNGGEALDGPSSILQRLQLVVQRLFADAVGLGAGDRGAEVRELLDDDVLAVLQRDRVLMLDVSLQGRLARLQLVSGLGEARVEPVEGFARRGKLRFR